MIKDQTINVADLEPYQTYQQCTLVLPSIPSHVSDVHLNRCQFVGDLDHSEWLDCHFQDCDFANRTWTHSVLYRCTFTRCNLLGTAFLENRWQDVTVTESRGDYLNLSGSQLTRCRLTATTLKEAYLRACRVTPPLVLDRCDLNQASFGETRLKGVYLTTSTFDQLEVDATPRSLAGLVINPVQAAPILGLFGVKIK